MRSVLVTGGAGYIGSHTCKALARAGYFPVVVDDMRTGHRWAVRWGPLVEGDISDRRLIARTIKKYHVEAVIHFAASALVGESMTNPHKYLHGNVAPSLELLEGMREGGIRHIVVSSSCAVYGIPARTPISESALTAPVNPYGESKLFVERALQWYAHSHGFSWVALRYFNAAGADPENEIGESHDPETHLIPSVIEAALGWRDVVEIMGTDYATEDGTAVRDYIHVTDLAEAHLKALQHLMHDGESGAINLGTGCGYSVRDVVTAVERVSGQAIPVAESPRRAGDPPVLVADSRRAEQVLGWTPKYRSLDGIVRTAWNWHLSQSLARTAAAAGD